MLGCDTLGKLDIIFRKATGRYDQFIGGLHCTLLGDFYQLAPFMAKALYVDDTWYNDINDAGKEAYLACTCYKELLQNFRQEKSSESVFVECLRRVRIGEATENDADFLQKRCCDIKDVASLPPTTLYIASRWETVDAGFV